MSLVALLPVIIKRQVVLTVNSNIMLTKAAGGYTSDGGSIWLPRLLLITLLVPIELSFSIGSFRLSLSRLLLILVAIPLIRRYISLPRKMRHEYMLFGYVLWIFISSLVNHGMAFSIERAGSLGLEVIVSFFIAALTIKNIKQWVATMKVVVVLICLLVPFVLVEALISQHFIHEYLSLLTGYVYPLPYEYRLGVLRSSGPFNHPILLGVFGATMVGIVWYGFYNSNWVKKAGCTFLLLPTTFLALSSAPIMLVIFQLFAITFNWVARRYKQRWKMFSIGVAVLYLVLLLFSNRSPFMVILSRITLDPSTSFYRLLTWEYGVSSVLANPLFGVGMNDWARAVWMVTSSIDSFWLKTAMIYGLPAAIMLILATVMITQGVVKSMKWAMPGLYKRLCIGWVVSMVSLILLGFTVDFFGEIYVYYFFLLGMGVSLVNMRKNGATGEADS